MKKEFELAFNEVLEEKQLPKEVILEALNSAMVSAYRRSKNASNAQFVEAKIDLETGNVAIFAEKEVVENVEDERTEVALSDALLVDEQAEIGSMVVVESTPRNFGRVAAQTARQVIQQRIREAEREAQFDHYSKQLGEVVSGVVQAVGPQGVTLGMDMKAEGIMPRNQQIPGERFRVHDRVRALLLEVKPTPRGPQIVLSRAHRNFLRRLLENEVPEIYHGLVEIRSISREPGHRSKVAVAALQAGVDPVGACVGIRGVRIQAIVRELNDEKIDVIEWNSDPSIYIAKALSPARVSGVYLNELDKEAKTATVVVPEDQLSLAIGRDGQNARLAAKLTAWRIDIKSLPEAAADALYRLQNDPEFAKLAEEETEASSLVSLILTKKAEGRPITPEEYQHLTQFVDRIERRILQRFQDEKIAEDEKIQEIRATIPPAAFEIPLEKFEISDRVYAVISEAGFPTVGDLMLQMSLDSDAILALHGMGPKGMKELEETIASMEFVEEIVEEEVEIEPVLEMEEIIEEIPEEVEEAEEMSTEAPAVSVKKEVEEVATTVEVPSGLIEPSKVEPEPIIEEVPVETTLSTQEVVEDEVDKVVVPEEIRKDQVEVTVPPGAEESEEEEEPSTFEELFTLRPEVLDFDELGEEVLDEEDENKKHRKKKKKKFVEIEYDPEQDAMLVKKKRKRGDEDWDEDW